MDSNKDEALRCINIAREAIADGNKQRAVKFIGIARRLNQNLSVDDLLTACENLASSSSDGGGAVDSDGVRNYTDEQVHLVREIKSKKDYYSILGLEKNCSVEEIRKAYRKLSLKVHPDKNKAPGSEEAFKKVSEAFMCLGEDDSRRRYDLVDESEYDQQFQAGGNDNEFDHDEVFRAFFGERDMFGDADADAHAPVYRSTGTCTACARGDFGGGDPNLMLLLQVLMAILLAYLFLLVLNDLNY